MDLLKSLWIGIGALCMASCASRTPVVIIASADWAWKHARDKAGLIYNDWTGNAEEADKPKWLLDESCMIELYTRIALIKGEVKK